MNCKKLNLKMLRGCSDLMTPQEVQNVLHIGRSTMYKLLKSKELLSIRVASKYLIPKAYLLDYLNENA